MICKYFLEFMPYRAHSSVVKRRIRIAEARVRFSLGPHFRKLQGIGNRLASLGGQFVLNFGRKNQLAILLLGKENFFIINNK